VGWRERPDEDLRREAMAIYRDPKRAALAASDRTLALITEAIRRETSLVLHPNQVMAAAANRSGEMVELATGEGKTLSALAVAISYALAGRPVHVITANSYLAKRDGALARAVVSRLALTAASLTQDVAPDERPAAYRHHLLYTTLKDVGFDWLRDRVAIRDGRHTARLQGRLDVAVVDEADLVLIDEARVPLILSAPVGEAREQFYQ